MATINRPSEMEEQLFASPAVLEERQATFAIEGMTCASCAMRIEKGLKKIPGIIDANVNLATEKAMVTYDPAQAAIEQMVQKVDAVGYKATPLTLPHAPQETEPEACAILNLEGMTCASCAMRIEKGLKKVTGVRDANVNLATEKATVTYDPAQTDVAQMIQKVEAVGYGATLQAEFPSQQSTASLEHRIDISVSDAASSLTAADEQSVRRQREITRKRNLLILGIVLTLPIVILGMFFMNAFAGENYLLLALTTPV